MSVEIGPPDAGPEAEHGHHHPSGHRWLDITLAVSAVFISLISLFLAIQHGRVMEKMMEASTWAFVTVESSSSNLDYTPHARIMVRNKGVGPARLETLELFYNGIPQVGPHALLKTILKLDAAQQRHNFLVSDVAGTVLSAKEEVDLVDFDPKGYTPEEYAAIQRELVKLTTRICYCSVLEECSFLDDRDLSRRSQPVAVKTCPTPATPFRSEM